MLTTWNADVIYEETIKPKVPSEPYPTPFSRAWHFAVIIVPIFIALITMLATDRAANLKDVILISGHVIGYTAAVMFLLRSMEKVERMEATNGPVVYDEPFNDTLLRNAA